MNSCRFRLTLSSSAIALVAATALVSTGAHAQNSSAAVGSATTETVVVTGSRIQIQGYQAPTPVTVIGSDQIAREAQTDIGDVIRELPSVGASASPNNGVGSNNASQGDSGLDSINLRNLGAGRTLILFNGQRVVSSNLIAGGVDLSTIPNSLVKRIDVVTGGASAAYGSDAVGGVVNLILNTDFTGFKGDIQAGDTTTFTHRQIKGEASYGTDFGGSNFHLIVSGAYTMSPDTVFAGMEPYNRGSVTIQNPAATSANLMPIFVHVYNAGTNQFTTGGLVTANTAGGTGSTLAANQLKGINFGPGGSVGLFNFGQQFGSNCFNGCTNNQYNTAGAFGLVSVPYHQGQFFTYASYQVSPDIKASIQLNYGTNSEKNTATSAQKTFTTYADNPYLPASVVSQFGTLTYAAGSSAALASRPNQTLSIGTNNFNNTGIGTDGFLNANETYVGMCKAVGQVCDTDSRFLMRGVATLEGTFWNDWSWETYVQHGEVRERQIVKNDPLTANLNFAIEPIMVTAANVGTSGLPIGTIQCRALVQGNAAAAGCVPYNYIGTGVATDAAYQYINPGETATGRLNQELIILNQTVVAGSVQGLLPWGLPAGNVATSFGAEYRHEQAGVQANGTDPGGLTAAWQAGNFVPFKGQYNTKEAFVEVDAPLLKDQFVQTLNLNAAGRFTDYSTSGAVQTWKLGLTSQVNDDIKLRTTWSLDIRAPIISDLFSPGTPASQTCTWVPGTPSYPCFQLQAGNSALLPEKAVTVSGGVVLTPHWVDGLMIAADWYSINLHGGINSTGFQTIINRCQQNNEQVYCNALSQFNAAGQPTRIFVGPLNAAVISTSGLDFQSNYRMDLFSGNLSFNLSGGMVSQYNQDVLGVNYDQAGATGAGSFAGNGIPKWRGNLSATYSDGPWSGTVQGRFLGAQRITNGDEGLAGKGLTLASVSATGVVTTGTVFNPNQIDNNNIRPVAYLDMRGSYRLTDNMVLYGAIDNVTNVPPPVGGAATIYDFLGRSIRAGVRVSY